MLFPHVKRDRTNEMPDSQATSKRKYDVKVNATLEKCFIFESDSRDKAIDICYGLLNIDYALFDVADDFVDDLFYVEAFPQEPTESDYNDLLDGTDGSLEMLRDYHDEYCSFLDKVEEAGNLTNKWVAHVRLDLVKTFSVEAESEQEACYWAEEEYEAGNIFFTLADFWWEPEEREFIGDLGMNRGPVDIELHRLEVAEGFVGILEEECETLPEEYL